MAINKNYNAESAWNYLGAGLFDGRGAYDYAVAPSHLQEFASITRMPNFPQVGDGRAQYRFDPGQIDKYLLAINNYPEVALNNTLAGKFTRLF
jgi:hypothetical protein